MGEYMTIQSDKWIREQCEKHKMIHPYVDKLVSDKVISFGQSSYGYDIRVANRFKTFTTWSAGNPAFIDPKDIITGSYNYEGPSYHIPPHGFTLAYSYEYIKVPDDCIVYVVGKSTYARCGLHLNFTVLEPGWEGNITLELSNCTDLPLKIYAMEGIAQLQFFKADEKCLETYADRGGKYMKQTGITLPKVK